MNEKQIMVMIKRPGEEPDLDPLFDNDLKAFQEAVGGYIETVTLTPEIVVICNEEGRLRGLPFNVEISGIGFLGTIVIAGVKGDEFSSIRAAAIPLVRRLLGG